MTAQELYRDVLLQEAKRIREFISKNKLELGTNKLIITANVLEERAEQLLNEITSNGTPLS
tara:strand:+ start:103 stop:285 length:183 start_codon:yes stop_codon:yes gene_type:complete